jgi:hypothetical protein
VAGDMYISLNYKINGTNVLSSSLLTIPTISNVLNTYSSNVTATNVYAPILSNNIYLYSSNVTATNLYAPVLSNNLNIYSTNITATNITGKFLTLNTPIPSITNDKSLIYLSNPTSGFNLVLYNSSNVTNPNTCALECSASPLYISLGGAEKMRFLQNRNIGIGTSTPSCILDVNGDLN